MAEVRHLSLGNGRVLFGAAVVLLLAAVAFAAPLLAPHDPLEQDLLLSFSPPFWRNGTDASYLLGTDSLGRDILSRLIYGARIALTVALVAATLAALLGTALGLLSGYFGGYLDAAISRLVDVWMSFPPVLLSVVLAAVVGAGLKAVILAIIVVDWTRFCRIVRAEVLVQREQDYVAAAVTIGLNRWRILWVEILPNLVPTLLVLLTLEMGVAVIVEAILSFVGLSVASDAPTWGGLIQEGRLYINQAWWMMALPMACIITTVLGFNALGDGLREVLDPVLRR
ncbi:MAG TPA: ABC transporter permease [Stellaceae bacterium]|nr:ABC transporter permease [Stellaceae bacterium]